MLEICNTKIRKNIILALVAIIGAGTQIGWQGGLRPVFSQSMDQISISLSVFDAKNEAVDGTFQIRFALYTKDRTDSDPFPSNADSGSRIWSETKTVTVKNGIIRTDLGDTTALPKELFSDPTQDYYLGIQIGEDSEMVPRKKVASVPSALNARSLDGKTIGTKSGDIPLIGSGGKLPASILPTTVDTAQFVLSGDGRLHSQNTDTGTSSNTFTIGSGTALGAANFDLAVSGASSAPALRYDAAAGSWQLSSGSGSFSRIITEASGGQMGEIVFDPNQTFGGATLTELGYLQNSRGNIQAQIDALPHTASDFTSGTLPASLGGTGLDSSHASNGALLIGNGSGFSLGELQFAGAGLAIQNGSGFIKITNTGVANIIGTLNQINVSGENALLTLSLPQDIAMASSPTFSGLILNRDGYDAKTTFTNSVGQMEDITYTLPTEAGTTDQVLRYKSDGTLSWQTITGGAGSGIGTVLSVAAGDGLATDVTDGDAITESGTLSIALSSDATDTLTVSSPSGLEFENHKLSLLRGCASDQVLSWDEPNRLWRCASIAGSSGLIGGGATDAVAYWSADGTLSSETNLAVLRGGTGLGDTPLPGQLLIGNGVGYTLATVTPGAGITVTNSLQSEAGSITIASTLGTSVDLASEVNGTLPVTNGGTGATSLTSNGVLYGNGTGAIQATSPGISGQFLLVNASGNPAFGSLSGDATLDSAGSLTIASGVVTGAKIADDTIKEVNLKAATKTVDGVALPLGDGDILTYNALSGGFMWSSAGTGGIGDIVTIGDVTKGDAFNDGGSDGTALWFHNGTKQGQLTTEVLNDEDRTYTLPDSNGTILTTGNLTEIISVGALQHGSWEADTISPRYGGTGLDGSAAADGTLLIGNGTGYTLATLTQGNGIKITNGEGSITLASDAPTSTVNGTNVTGAISGNVLTLGWTGILAATSGGTGYGEYTVGDILYADTTSTLAKLPIGPEAYVLRSVDGVPTWQEFSQAPTHLFLSDRHTDTVPGTVARGDLIVGQGLDAKWQQLSLGATGTVFKSDGLDAVWGTLGKGDVGLGNVENTALSTWDGSANIVKLGTVISGAWNGTVVGSAYGGTGLDTSTRSGTPYVSDGVWDLASALGVAYGGTGVSTPFDAGSIVFMGASGAYAQDNANLFWDTTNKKLGIGTKTPANTLQVVGDASISGGVVASSDLTVGGNIKLPNTVDDTTGVIFKGANRFIHNFSASETDGENFFAGSKAGNFSLTGSYSTAIGDSSLTVLTTGNGNTAVGAETLLADTTGSDNVALGYQALSSNVSGSSNVAVGKGALSNIAGSSNNVALGYQAGALQADGSSLVAATNSVYIGYNAKGKSDSDSNSIVIGSGAVGLGANTTVLGTSNTTLTHIFGDMLAGGDLSVEGTLSVLEGGDGPTYHTVFRGGDQDGDITYMLPTSNSIGFLKNGANGVLTWDGGSYPTGTGTNGQNAYWTGTGTLGSEAHTAISRGGTGIGDTPTDGQLLIGNASGGYTLAALTQGSGITVTNVSGGVTIATTAPTSVATSDANLRGTIFNNSLVLNWEGILSVSRGGTGTSTFTQNGVLFGSGTNAISATAAGTSSQFLISNAYGVPMFVSMSGDATISAMGALTIGSNAVGSDEITNNTIKAEDILSSAPSAGQILSYNSGTGGFNWIDNSGGSGASKWTDGGDFTYLTQTADDAVFGSDNGSNAPFAFDVSTGNILLGGVTRDAYKTVLQVTDPTGDNVIVVPNAGGEMSLLGQSIDTGEIEDGTILPSDLFANTPANGAVLMYDPTGDGKFAWGVAGSGGIGDMTQVGDVESGSAFTDGGAGTALWFHNGTKQGKLTTTALDTADRTYTLPDASGTIWTSGNQGTGSGLDADLFDGHDSSYFQVAMVNPVTGTGTDGYAAYWTASGLAGEQYLSASRGGTGISTVGQTGIPIVTGGVWSVAASLGVAQGGTGATTLASKGVLYGNGTGAVSATTAGTEAQFLVANASSFPTFVSMSGDATITAAGVLTIGSDAVALGTDTSGNYVASIANGSGISGGGSGSESAALTLSLGNLTSNWTQTGAYDIKLSNANSELYIMDGSSSYYGIFDISALSADQTYAFGTGGTVWTSGSDGTGSGLDADKLDGHETAYFQAALTDPVTGTGTNGYAAYWTASGLAGEQYLSASRGGTGISTVGQTGVPTISSGVWTVASSIGVAQGGTGTTTQFAQGSIVFAGANGVYTQNNSNLFWDNSNSRLGLGTTTPTAKLDVKGSGTLAVIGSELITNSQNRDFSNDTGDWSGTNWTITSPNATHDPAGANPYTLSTSALASLPVSGKIYQISFSATTSSAGLLGVSFGSTPYADIPSPTGTNTILITATGSGALVFSPNASWLGTISNVSVKEVTNSDPIMIARNADGSSALEIRGGDLSSKGTFLGVQAGRFTTGQYNSFIGYQSGSSNTSGSSNNAVGYNSLYSNTAGSSNTAVGYNSLYANTAGGSNNAVGTQSLYSNTTGNSNNAVGYQSLYSNTTGSYNSAMGAQALYSNTTGTYNVAMGYRAGRYQQDGSTALTAATNSIYIGYNAKGYNNTDSNSIVIGYNAVGLGPNTTVLGNSSTTLTHIYGGVEVGSTATNANKNLTVNGTVSILEGVGTDAQTYYTAFQGGANQAANITYTLPTASTNGLLRNTAGVLTWDGVSGNVSGSGTGGYSAYWTGSNTIGSEQYASVSRGGTGIGTTPTNGQVLIGNGSGYSLATIAASGAGISVANGVGTITISNTGVTSLSGTANQVNVSSSTGGVTLSLPQNIGTTSSPSFAGATLSNITAGSALFAGTGGIISQDNANFFWDATNHRLGLGTVTPAARLDIKGAGTLVSTGTELISNQWDREFSGTGSNHWSGTGWTYSGNLYYGGGSANDVTLASNATNFSVLPIYGHTYQISFFAYSATTTGTLGVSFGSASYGDGPITYPMGTTVITIRAGGTGPLIFSPGSGWTGYLDNISVVDMTASTPIMVARNADDTVALEIRGGATAGTFLGYQSGQFSTGASDSFLGYQSGAANTSGYQNSAMGYQALYRNTTGYDNSAMGYQALINNISGTANVAVGSGAMYTNTAGNYNVAIGNQALYKNVSGVQNSAVGWQSLYKNTTGAGNIAFGYQALNGNTTGNYNSAIGVGALYNNSTGTGNVAFGYQAGQYQSNGSTVLSGATNSIYIGYGVKGFSDADNNSIVIGSGAVGLGANTTVLGSSSTTLTKLNGNLALDASKYVNFGSTTGSSGYGFYDNAGTIQFKNSGGVWQSIGQTMAIGGPINSATAGSVLFVNSSNQLAQSNSNFFWDNSNYRLGIGTTSPSELLHILKTSNADTRMQISNLNTGSAATAGLKLTSSGGDSLLYMTGSGNAIPNALMLQNNVANNGPIVFNTTNNVLGEAMRITSYGNVGIGTTTPTANFQVNQPTTGLGTVSNSANGTTVTGIGTKFTNTFKVGDSITINGQSVTISAIASDTSMTTAAILNANTNASYTLTGGTRLYVAGNGNVGIGTASPSTMLSLYGTTNAARLSYDATHYATLSTDSLGDLSVSGSQVYDASLIVGNNTANNAVVSFDTLVSDFYAGVDSSDSGKFKIGRSSKNASLTIDSLGNIGIGTGAPGHMLDVAGNIGLGVSSYINFGSTDGDSGYGFRDFGGTLQLKGSGGSWQSIGTVGGSGTAGYNAYWTASNTLGSEQYVAVSRGGTGSGSTPSTGQFLIGNGSTYNPGSFTTSGAGISATSSSSGILLALDQGIAVTSTPTFAGISIVSGGSTLMSVTDTASTFNNPTAFTAVGDVSMAYDLIMTNQTSSFIKSNGPLSLESGEVFESNDLTLRTFNAGEVVVDGGAGAAYPFHAFRSSDGNVAGFTDSNGTCSINPTNTALICSSDATLKKDIVSLSAEDSLATVNKLRPVDFHWNSESSSATLHTGLIAQEVQTVLPNLVSTGPEGKLAVNYLGLMPYAISAIQAQQTQITALSARIAGLDLKTDQDITTLGQLQTSVDAQLSVIGDSMKELAVKQDSLDDKMTTLDGRVLSAESSLTDLVRTISDHEDRIATMEAAMTTLKDEHLTLMDFFSTFKLNKVVMRDELDNVDLLGGKLTAKVVETGELVIEVLDPTAPTIGTATLYPVAKDVDGDGNDDYTGLPMTDKDVSGRDGKTVNISTTAVSDQSLVYVTPVGSTGNKVIFVGNIKDQEGFSVGMDAATTEAVRFNWWIVGKKRAEAPSVPTAQ